MIGRLPVSLVVGGTNRKIRTDFRDILTVMEACNDPDLTPEEFEEITLTIIYEDIDDLDLVDYPEAFEKAIWFIDCGKENDKNRMTKKTMDWEQDESIIFSAVNKVAHQEVRIMEYMHWWTFIGFFMEIDDGTFSMVLNIRQKKSKGKKLEKWEQDFYRDNKEACDLKVIYTEEEKAEIDYWNKLLG